jgi:hypothetical protein
MGTQPSLKISTAVRAGESLVPARERDQYFALAADRGAMFACVTGCAYLGSYPTSEATKERDRIYNLMKFGDGKIHTAAHAITKRLYAAFPQLGKNIKEFPVLLKLSPLKIEKEQLKYTTLFGHLTDLFRNPENTVKDLVRILERAGL